jgi:hypothetical protein
VFRRRGAAPGAFDRTAFRRRAEELKAGLEAALAGQPAGLLAALRGALGGLEALFNDLVAAGDRDPAVERLGRLLLQARALLAGADPQGPAAAALCRDLAEALRQWLALPAAPPERGEGFWK